MWVVVVRVSVFHWLLDRSHPQFLATYMGHFIRKLTKGQLASIRVTRKKNQREVTIFISSVQK